MASSGALDDLDPERLQALLRGSGAWGAALYVLMITLLQPLFVSVWIFLLAGALVWSPGEAVLLAWLGTLGSGITSYTAGRWFARDWVSERMPDRIRALESHLETRPFVTVLVIRLVFYTTPLIQTALGATRLRFAPYLAATAVGNIPQTVIGILLGHEAAAWVTAHPPETWPWPAVAVGSVLVAATAVALRGAIRRGRTLAAEVP